MASGFWYLEDGRCFARQYGWMCHMLELITDEIKIFEGAKEFYEYLHRFIPEKDDGYNGHGGYINAETGETVVLWLDLREFTDTNRQYFWKGAQNALAKLIQKKDESYEGYIHLLKVLLDMHKRITKGEDQQLLNHVIETEPYSGLRKGPGWE